MYETLFPHFNSKRYCNDTLHCWWSFPDNADTNSSTSKEGDLLLHCISNWPNRLGAQFRLDANTRLLFAESTMGIC